MNKTKVLLSVFIVLLVLVIAEGFYYLRLTKRSSEPKIVGKSVVVVNPGKYRTLKNVSNYSSPDENKYRSYIIPGKTFSVEEQKGEWLRIDVWEEKFQTSWEGWIKVDETAYEMIGGAGQ